MFCRSSCRQPRLPLSVPRADSETMELNGVTRFCRGTRHHSKPREQSVSNHVSALHWPPEHLDASDVHETSPPMAAAGQQIGEANLVNLAQIRLLHIRLATRHHTRDVERQP